MPFISMEHIVTMLSVALPVAASLFVFYRGFSKPCDQRRYDELVAPLFELIEPYLFKGEDYQRREVEKAMQLIEAKKKYCRREIDRCPVSQEPQTFRIWVH